MFAILRMAIVHLDLLPIRGMTVQRRLLGDQANPERHVACRTTSNLNPPRADHGTGQPTRDVALAVLFDATHDIPGLGYKLALPIQEDLLLSLIVGNETDNKACIHCMFESAPH